MPRPSVSAEIIAKAGEKGAVTVATNMAGRGTDIKLTEETKAIMFSYKRQIQKLPEVRLPARGAIERAATRSLVFISLALNFSGSLMAGGVDDKSDLLREPVGIFYMWWLCRF